MRSPFLPLALLTVLPLAAEAPTRSWYVGLQRTGPTFEGHFEGVQDGQPILVDLQKDLAILKDQTKVGAFVGYDGPRFALFLSMDEQTYKGANTINRTITISGQDYNAGAFVQTDLKIKTYTFNWTIKALRFEQAYVGVDLGLRSWDMDLVADGNEPFTGVKARAVEKFPIPIPQVGLCVGFHGLERALEGRVGYSTLFYSGAKYHRMNVEASYFPLDWVGIRAFLNTETIDVPKGSLKDDLELKLDRKSGAGFGVVFRF